MSTTKTCTQCNDTKPITQFYKQAKQVDGHTSECKSCFKSRVDARYKASDAYHDAQFNKAVRSWASVVRKERKAAQKAAADSATRTYRNTMGQAIAAEGSRRSTYKADGYALPDDFDKFNCIMMYYKRNELTASTGVPHEVDHITPVHMGGVHHHSNLQVITTEEHLSKTRSELSELNTQEGNPRWLEPKDAPAAAARSL